MSGLQPAVFLDRDGTLNTSVVRDGLPRPPASLEEFQLIPGVVEACRKLRDAGFVLVVATNQPDVGRGTVPRELVETLHARLLELLPIERIEVCYHPGRGFECECRKPRPGMLQRAAAALGLDLARSWMVGDRWRDIDCGYAAGCRTIFIDQGYRESLRARPNFIVRSLGEAADIILSHC